MTWKPGVLYMNEATAETFYSPDSEEQVWFATPQEARAVVGDWQIMIGAFK